MDKIKSNINKFPEGSVCKPCWELKYCPYGDIVEWFPLVSNIKDQFENSQISFEQCVQDIIEGKCKSKEDVWCAVNKFMSLMPSHWEFYTQYDPQEVSCSMRGHVCPVFFYQHGATETKEVRRDNRYISRDIMLKVVRRDNYTCQVCFKHTRDNEVEFDHVIPYSKGGPTSVENIRLLCKQCNRKKSNSLKEILSEPLVKK